TLEIPNYSAVAAQNQGALRFNTENTAHYITDYQGLLLDQVLDTITELVSTSKLQVVQERRLLAEAGHISFAELVPVIENLTEESSYLVVSGVKAVLSGLKIFVEEGSESEEA
ncbi:aminopeptidase, partial [Streptococcus gordonii]|nr:aminopeptidase [Streptococcus gordonii]